MAFGDLTAEDKQKIHWIDHYQSMQRGGWMVRALYHQDHYYSAYHNISIFSFGLNLL